MKIMLQKLYSAFYLFFISQFISPKPAPKFTANVMAPLYIEGKEWKDFEHQLRICKKMGINAVSTDVWWGLVETEDGQFDWSYYDAISEKIENAGLKWIPIMSFHMCGPNVGDEHKQPLPHWIWDKLVLENYEIASIEELKYVSEEGTSNHEVVSLWADQYVLPIYKRFIQNFKTQYQHKIQLIEEINVSFGTAGELRYPSYNYHDGGNYPNRGRLQCYSKLAKQDFRKHIKHKYRTINRVNKAWSTHIHSFKDVQPPDNVNIFFNSNAYKMTRYGREFIDWYHHALVHHGKRMLNMAHNTLNDGDWKHIPIGFKIPGVHWAMTHPQIPRSAEISAGLITSYHHTEGNGYGYQNIIEKVISPKLRKRTVLHFTCLEMSNHEAKNVYSKAKSLVYWVGNVAHELHITVRGENALSFGVLQNQGWDNIEDAIQHAHYSGLTVLRIKEATSAIGQERYGEVIKKYKE